MEALSSLSTTKMYADAMSVSNDAFKAAKPDVDKLEDTMSEIEEHVRMYSSSTLPPTPLLSFLPYLLAAHANELLLWLLSVEILYSR